MGVRRPGGGWRGPGIGPDRRRRSRNKCKGVDRRSTVPAFPPFGAPPCIGSGASLDVIALRFDPPMALGEWGRLRRGGVNNRHSPRPVFNLKPPANGAEGDVRHPDQPAAARREGSPPPPAKQRRRRRRGDDEEGAEAGARGPGAPGPRRPNGARGALPWLLVTPMVRFPDKNQVLPTEPGGGGGGGSGPTPAGGWWRLGSELSNKIIRSHKLMRCTSVGN